MEQGAKISAWHPPGSSDNGQTFTGTMTYAGEGPLGFQATLISGNSYNAQVQWGGSTAPWNEDGTWVIGARDNQPCVSLNVTSSDGGQTLNGTNTYSGEGPIGFKGTLA